MTTIVQAQKSKDLVIIPPNFTGFTGTLLIKNCDKKVITKILEKRFSKFYKGEFEMIEEDDADQRSYKDLKKFPFVLKYKGSYAAINTRGPSSDSYRFEMTDRVTGKVYYTSWNADNTIPAYANMNSFAKELERLRGK